MPEDDGAADHLVGLELPELALDSSRGRGERARLRRRSTSTRARAVRTGRCCPGWDETPGARGCTPQSCAFRDVHAELAALGVRVAGLSAQSARRPARVRRAQPHAVPGDLRPGAAPRRALRPADVRDRRPDALQADHARRGGGADRRRSSIRCSRPTRTPATCSTGCEVAMKLVTYDDGKVGRDRRRRDRPARRPDMREYFERGGADDDRRAHAARRRRAARADRAEEVLPHRRQLPRARGRVEERRLVARDRAVDRLLPERRRDHRPRRAGRLPGAPDRGARLRARARRRDRQGRQVVRARGGDGLHRRLRDLQRHHRARHPAARDALAASSRSARRSTRSARSGRGSSRPTRSPTRTIWR